jgi:hypothetical protein
MINSDVKLVQLVFKIEQFLIVAQRSHILDSYFIKESQDILIIIEELESKKYQYSMDLFKKKDFVFSSKKVILEILEENEYRMDLLNDEIMVKRCFEQLSKVPKKNKNYKK